ncbi:MAG: SgcJ/EcaC family oxidoreductase [Methylophilaceae bacterium]
MNKILILSTSLMLGVFSLPAHAEKQECAAVNKAQISALFDRWNDALKTGNPDAVTKLYSDDAVLLPTVSNKPRDTHEEISDYFVHFLQKHPQGRIDSRTIKLGCNTATDMGIYTFKVKADGKNQEIQARYTFQYAFEDGKWVIEHHHSSAMPEKSDAKEHH